LAHEKFAGLHEARAFRCGPMENHSRIIFMESINPLRCARMGAVMT